MASELLLTGPSEPGTPGDLRGGGDRLRLGLQAHLADRLVGRPDELEVATPADLGEVRVLAQEAVAGVDRLDVGDFGGGDEPGDVQVAVGTRSLPMQIARSASFR